VVIEERTAPAHQLVILGHELWHMKAGHRGHHVAGAGVATRLLDEDPDEEALTATVMRVAARTRFDLADEKEAEAFGLLLASKCRTWLAGSSLRGPVQRDHLAGRIEAALGYQGPTGGAGATAGGPRSGARGRHPCPGPRRGIRAQASGAASVPRTRARRPCPAPRRGIHAQHPGAASMPR